MLKEAREQKRIKEESESISELILDFIKISPSLLKKIFLFLIDPYNKWRHIPWRIYPNITEKENLHNIKEEKKYNLNIRLNRIKKAFLWIIGTTIIFFILGFSGVNVNKTISIPMSTIVAISILIILHQTLHIATTFLFPKIHEAFINREYPYLWITTWLKIALSILNSAVIIWTITYPFMYIFTAINFNLLELVLPFVSSIVISIGVIVASLGFLFPLFDIIAQTPEELQNKSTKGEGEFDRHPDYEKFIQNRCRGFQKE